MREDIQLNHRAAAISEQLIEQLQTIFDPEIGLDIYNLGFVYEIHLDEQAHCEITITFTGIGCECIESIPDELKVALTKIDEIQTVDVKIVWSPAWKMTRISRYGRIALGVNPN
ncbi:metal-sulfur cluster assembly factor [Enterococcus sp. LJL98]